MDSTRRSILAAGVAAAAAAAVPRIFAQQTGQGGKFYERGPTRIHYEETGSGVPLLLLPGGGLNATIGFFTGNSPFNAIDEFKGEYRCITADLRNAPSGQSTGPVEVDRPWESYADDQLGLMDHLGIDKFMVMGFCIGGPFIWNLLRRAPGRIAAAVLAQPISPDLFFVTGYRVFMVATVAIAVAGMLSVPALRDLFTSYPIASAGICGVIIFPLAKTIIESFDGSLPFIMRLRNNYARWDHCLRGGAVALLLARGAELEESLDGLGRARDDLGDPRQDGEAFFFALEQFFA